MPIAAARIDVVIPALDEAAAIGDVVRSVPRPPVHTVWVVDNGSRDATARRAADAGASVLHEAARGYGAACLRGIAAMPRDTTIVVFLDGDGSDDPTLLPLLVQPIVSGEADLVVGSRVLGQAQRGALTLPQRLGNALATAWLRRRFRLAVTDLGPFRAIRTDVLAALAMHDRTYGWTVEMQIKAARLGLRYREIPAPYRRRIGRSKISGTVRGTVSAGAKILGLLMWHDLLRPRLSPVATAQRQTDCTRRAAPPETASVASAVIAS
jgi:glycosyltransferase involved in cell wall biosynthesis